MPSPPAAGPTFHWCLSRDRPGKSRLAITGISCATPMRPRRPSVRRRVFLSLGRLDLHAFAPAPQHHYIARTIDPPQQTILPPDIHFLQARGPFDRESETRLLRDEKIEVLVSKNSGGTPTYAKIEAARDLGLPVVMIARPHKAAGHVVHSAEQAVAWLDRHLHDAAPSPRGV
jgi:precorrin-6A/cobalt-precorrin-6A reductase